jgi:hypothetical protein
LRFTNGYGVSVEMSNLTVSPYLGPDVAAAPTGAARRIVEVEGGFLPPLPLPVEAVAAPASARSDATRAPFVKRLVPVNIGLLLCCGSRNTDVPSAGPLALV